VRLAHATFGHHRHPGVAGEPDGLLRGSEDVHDVDRQVDPVEGGQDALAEDLAALGLTGTIRYSCDWS
jgi:hypothetical protein